MKLFGWTKLVANLESQAELQRQDFVAMRADKDSQIRALRMELGQVKAECDRLRSAPSVKQVPIVHEAPESQDWQGALNKMLKEEEDGIRSSGRIQEHEQSSHDGA